MLNPSMIVLLDDSPSKSVSGTLPGVSLRAGLESQWHVERCKNLSIAKIARGVANAAASEMQGPEANPWNIVDQRGWVYAIDPA